jgi:succinate dehydrogenase hydrophobic anchor subunit
MSGSRLSAAILVALTAFTALMTLFAPQSQVALAQATAQGPTQAPVQTPPAGLPGASQFGASLPGTAPGAASPADVSEDIRDIRGAKYVMPAWLVPAITAALLALVLAGYGVWRWIKRRRQPRLLLPYEQALQRLEELRPLMQPRSAREFSIAVSDIVRGYIEQRFDATAAHRTTEEFLRDLLESTNPTLARHRPLLSEFLHQCDLVKFAGVSLSVANMESLQQSARAFVLETAKPEPPTSPAVSKEAHDSLPAT